MPISGDETDFRNPAESGAKMSKAELRKTHKPIMEKRRRARINHCLNEIKSLILEAMNKDPSRHSKLEKADILEMAVKHLQSVQRQQLAMAMATDPSVLRKFKSGFNDCTGEIDKYLGQVEGLDSALKQRVLNHLQKCIGGIEQVAHFNFPGLNNLPFLTNSVIAQNLNKTVESNVGDQNNNPPIQIPQGIQLIPSRLPTGELALLLPNSSNLPCFPNLASNEPNEQRKSAFSLISSSLSSKPLSPPQSPRHDILPQERSASPHGFRPVNPASKRLQTLSLLSTVKEEAQVPQISSTVQSEKATSTEVKTMKFPIHNYQEKERKFLSPKKFSEPLCIITNQNERYKLAQMREDSANYEENQRGIKRKYNEISPGLLTVSQDIVHPEKIIKVYPIKPFVTNQDIPSTSTSASSSFSSRDSASDSNTDMWRPW